MSDLSQPNSQVTHRVGADQTARVPPKVLTGSSVSKTYQSVAQTAALAIQDATDNLRNLSLISTTTIGVALAKSLAQPTKAFHYSQTIKDAQGVITGAADNLKTVGTHSADILKSISEIATIPVS